MWAGLLAPGRYDTLLSIPVYRLYTGTVQYIGILVKPRVAESISYDVILAGCFLGLHEVVLGCEEGFVTCDEVVLTG